MKQILKLMLIDQECLFLIDKYLIKNKCNKPQHKEFFGPVNLNNNPKIYVLDYYSSLNEN